MPWLPHSIRFPLLIALLSAACASNEPLATTPARTEAPELAPHTTRAGDLPGRSSSLAAEPIRLQEARDQEQALAPDDVEQDIEEVLPSLDKARPFEWSWDSFVGILTGRETFTAREGRVSFRLGTSLQLDGTTGWVSDRLENNFGSIDSDLDLRRLRLSSHGRVDQMNFAVSADLGVDGGLKDAWLEGREGGLALWGTLLGKFRFGQMREPFGFESQTSSGFLSFLERSLPTQTLTPSRNLGVMVHDESASGRVHWSAGMFSLGKSGEDIEGNSLFSLTARVTGLPIYKEDGSRLLHVGASLSSRNPTTDIRYFSRPEARFIDPYADTGDIDASKVNLFGAEIAGVRGPLWAQAEWIYSRLTAAEAGDPSFHGGYAKIGWFLTGEYRPYRKQGAVFDRFRPELQSDSDHRIVNWIRGGAWELVARASHIDLDDEEVAGGKVTNFSAALNWHISYSTRLQLNYIYSIPKDRGNSNIILLRFQYQPW